MSTGSDHSGRFIPPGARAAVSTGGRTCSSPEDELFSCSGDDDGDEAMETARANDGARRTESGADEMKAADLTPTCQSSASSAANSDSPLGDQGQCEPPRLLTDGLPASPLEASTQSAAHSLASSGSGERCTGDAPQLRYSTLPAADNSTGGTQSKGCNSREVCVGDTSGNGTACDSADVALPAGAHSQDPVGCQQDKPQAGHCLSRLDLDSAVVSNMSPAASLFSGSEGESVADVQHRPETPETEMDTDNGLNSPTPPNGTSSAANSLAVPGISNGHGDDGSNSSSQLPENDPSEDSNWISRRKHFFILSNAGKPIFSRYGSEASLAGFMGVICGMLSFMETAGDDMQSMRAGGHSFVFLCRGPLFLVAVSKTGEPVKCLVLQLELLHLSIIGILTNAVERIFHRSPSYDMRQLMGGTGAVLRSLIHSFCRDPSAMLVSIPSMPLPPLQRRVLQDALGGACGPGLAMYGMLLAGNNVAGLVEPKGAPLHPHDVLLVSNFVRSNESFRQAESFSPICLPHFNSAAYLHAYISYVAEGVCLVLLASQPDAFYRLATSKSNIEATLHSASVLEEIQRQLESPAQGNLDIEKLPKDAGGGCVGSTCLWHFIYRSPTKRQLIVASCSASAAQASRRKAAIRSYNALAAQMHDLKGIALQRFLYSLTDEMGTLAALQPDCELYAIFDPLTEKAQASQVARRLTSWIKSKYTELFIPLGD